MRIRTARKHRRDRAPDTSGTARTGRERTAREHEGQAAAGEVPGENRAMKDVWWTDEVTGAGKGLGPKGEDPEESA